MRFLLQAAGTLNKILISTSLISKYFILIFSKRSYINSLLDITVPPTTNTQIKEILFAEDFEDKFSYFKALPKRRHKHLCITYKMNSKFKSFL